MKEGSEVKAFGALLIIILSPRLKLIKNLQFLFYLLHEGGGFLALYQCLPQFLQKLFVLFEQSID
jgi:hypothetical protein